MTAPQCGQRSLSQETVNPQLLHLHSGRIKYPVTDCGFSFRVWIQYPCFSGRFVSSAISRTFRFRLYCNTH